MKLAEKLTWYSNEHLGWIWCRSLIAILVGLSIVYIVFDDINEGPLFVVIGLPIFLAASNSATYFEQRNSSNDEEI
jgi:hypothetical protein